MKKFSNILATTIVALFLLSFGMKSEMKAQPCTNIMDTIVIDGCDYEIYMCVYCGAAYPGYVTVDSLRQISGCSSSLDPNEILQYAQKQASAALWYNYCQYNAPPCSGTERKEMTVKMYICWKARLEYASLAPPGERHRYVYIPCNYDDYCEVEYLYCADSLGVLQSTIGTSYTNFDPLNLGCSLEAEDIELPTIPPDSNGDESDCFILHTPCNLNGFNWNAP